MTQKLWNTCKKCGSDKPEDTEKLCEQCKAKRRQFWSDLKKVGPPFLRSKCPLSSPKSGAERGLLCPEKLPIQHSGIHFLSE